MENVMLRISRRFLDILMIMVVALLIWAYFTPWQSTITERFSVIGRSGTVIVSSPASGYVSKVLIQNGDWVETGQELMEFMTASQGSTVLSASSSGYFLAETSTAGGQDVAAGVPLARLTDTGSLVLQMFVAPDDLGQIRQGMPVIVQLDAFPSQSYGTNKAQVSWMAVIPTQQSPDGAPLYEVQAEITSAPPALASRLQPGLLGDADIITGEGRLISQVLPL
jgi:multidrug resistance efflux pump